MAPGSVSFHHVIRSAAPVDVVFAVLADGSSWSEWGGPMIVRSSWEREGVPAPGGVGAIRKLGAPPVWAREQITVYEPPRRMDYTILSGIPVRDYQASVVLTSEGETESEGDRAGTRIDWTGSFVPKVPGTGAVLGFALGRSVRALARRAAKHAENLVSRRP